MAEQHSQANAAIVIGEVKAVTGHVVAVSASGERTLAKGDPVYADDLIKTVGESTVVVTLNDGTRFDLGRDGEALLDDAVYANDVTALRAAAIADAAEIQQAIAAGADPTLIAEAPAAGGTTTAGSESLGEGVAVERTGRVGVVEAGYDTATPDPLLAATIDLGGQDGVTVVPPEATIQLDPITADNLVNAAEAGGQVVITGSVGGDVADGDVVTLTINGNSYEGVVAGGRFDIPVAGSDLVADPDQTVDASVTTTTGGPAGEATAIDTQSYDVNTVVPTAQIVIDPVTADNLVNAAESGGPVVITGSVGGDVEDGDVVTLTVNGKTYSGIVADGQFSIQVPGSDLAADPDQTLEASVTTTTGGPNGEATATATQSFGVDIDPPTASISIDPVTADNVLNAAESAGTVNITGRVGGDVVDGDIVTLVVNGSTFSGVVSGGGFSIPVPGSALAADPDHRIEGSVTGTGSPNGLATATDTQGYAVDTSNVDASISIDPITGDNVIDDGEAEGTVLITGSVGGDVADGDIVTVRVDGTNYTGAVSGGGFSISVPGAALVADNDHRIEARVTTTTGDPNGEATATATQQFSVGVEPPDPAAPTVTITEDVNNDGVISASELSGDIDVEVGLPAGAQVGDVITVSDGTTSTDITLDAADIAAGSVSASFPNPGNGNTINVTATLTDGLGNTSAPGSDTATVSTSTGGPTPPAPTVTITEDVNNDGTISASELSGDIDVEVGLPADAQVGDVITVSDGTTSTDITLDAADIAAGSVSASFPNPGDGNTINVTATLTDGLGNTSGPGSDSATIATTLPPAPTVTITEDVNNDGTINAAELSGDIDVEVGLPAGAQVGDVITVSDGTTSTDITLDAADIAAGSVSASFPNPGNGNTINVTATLTDGLGNTSGPGSDSAVIATTLPPAPTVTITEDVNNDGTINAAELSGDIDVEVGLPAGAQVGDVITVSDGTTSTDITLDAADIAAGSVLASFPNPGDGNTINVTATLTDGLGNTSAPGSDSATIATTLPLAPTVTITEDVNNDGTINAAELSGDIDVEVGLPAGAQVGDVITVSDGTTSTDITLDAADIAAGNVSTSFANPGDGNTINVTATLTDGVGNTSGPGSDSATIATTLPPAPTVTITEDVNNDGTINAAELSGDIDVEVGLPAGAQVGDVITVSDGITSTDITLDAADIAAGSVSASFPNPGDGNTINVTATLTDGLGNTSAPGNDSAMVATTLPPAPTVTITEDVNNDGTINAAELSGDIDVEVGLPAGAQVGDVITLSDGTTSTDITLDAADIAAGNVSTSFANPGDGNTINVTATLTDGVGNTSGPGSDSATIATTLPPAPTVTITEDVNNDGTINAAELSGDIDVEVGLPAGAQVGDVITVSDGTTSTDITLDAADIAAGTVSTSFPNPGDGNTINVTATLTDGLGNTSAPGSDSATIATTLPPAPTVTITEDVNDDGVISAAESNGDVDVEVGLPVGAQVGDVITVSDGTTSVEITLTADDLVAGAVGAAFPSPGDGGTIEVSATLTDGLGNTSAAATDSAVVDLDPTAGLTATITLDPNITANDIITPNEIGQMVPITGTVGGDVQDGDFVTVTVAGVDFIGQVSGGTFSIDVPASVLAADSDNVVEASVTTTDDVGNSVTATDVEGYSVAASIDISVTGMRGEYYGYMDTGPWGGWAVHSDDRTLGNLDSLNDLVTIINGRSGGSVVGSVDAGAADATFRSTTIDYGRIVGNLGTNLSLQEFLGPDAATLSTDPLNTTDGIIRIIGYMMIDASSLDFRVRSDDGFQIRIGDTTFGLTTNHSPQTDTFTGIDVEPGLQEVEILYWDQGGEAVLEIEMKETGQPDGAYEFLGSADFPLFQPSFIDGLDPLQSIIADAANPGEYLLVSGSELTGGAANDTLAGGDYLDILVGGPGDDLLTGGAGADTFVWNSGDQGSPGLPAIDTVTDFKLSDGDALNLGDLLVGESSGSLSDYLHFETSGADTVVHVSSNGGFAGGFNAAFEDQTIVLQNADLTALGGTDQEIINALLAGNNLITG